MNKLIGVAALAVVIPFIAACGDYGAGATPTTEAPTTALPTVPPTEAPTTTEPAATTTEEPSYCEEGDELGAYTARLVCRNGRWRAAPIPRPTTTTAAPTTTTAPSLPLATTDYAITLTMVGNQCFDSAGGLVTVEPTLSIVGVAALDTEATIVYEIHGGEHVETFNIDVDADGTYSFHKTVVDTPTCDVVPTALITQVIER